MLRVELPPPIELGPGPAARHGDPGRSTTGGRGPEPAHRRRLAAPHPAVERARPLFDPLRGWVRRSERAISHFLARVVYPRIPGLSVPYSAQLRRSLVLSETTIALAGLPEAFRGFRILLITDVHAGPFYDREVLGETFARLAAVDPDAILLGGDLVSARWSELRDHGEAFASLRAPCGVFAVLGNHDHYARHAARVSALAAELGIRVLQNRALPLERGGQRVWLAGVDDALLGRPDLERALGGSAPPVILLSHNPDLVFEASRRGVALVLSGHTHAGQIRIPGLPVVVRQSRFRLDQGRFRCRGTELVVSRGLGAIGLPLRVACPPEAVQITLDRR